MWFASPLSEKYDAERQDAQGIGRHDDDASRGVGIGAAMGLQRAEKEISKETEEKKAKSLKGLLCSRRKESQLTRKENLGQRIPRQANVAAPQGCMYIPPLLLQGSLPCLPFNLGLASQRYIPDSKMRVIHSYLGTQGVLPRFLGEREEGGPFAGFFFLRLDCHGYPQGSHPGR